jgi:hypothetical protein
VRLTYKQTGLADAIVLDDHGTVAEIRDLTLTTGCFRSGGRALIGPTVPLPLYWMQYANHQDPERNASSGARVTPVRVAADAVVLDCSGTTASGACRSSVRLTICRGDERGCYLYLIRARLEVVSQHGWLVTVNPSHGEVEFANLWVEGTFSPDRSAEKLYQACFRVTRGRVERISHHHLESSDKHNIPLLPGDRFLYLQEEENLALTLLSRAEVTAGVCAYMWDAHFAYKVCTEGKEVLLPQGSHFEAEYELASLRRSETNEIIRTAQDRPAPERARTPILVEGVNRFSETLDSARADWNFVWPWESEGGEGALLSVDRNTGYDDSASLRIDVTGGGRACWKATALGPAFGGSAFPEAARYRFSAYVKTLGLQGRAVIALRFHREGERDIFVPEKYETLSSRSLPGGDNNWTCLEIVTPPVSPRPDRFHLLIIQEGNGSTWFDNACLEVL